jgi:DNA-binding response OmpR family regulator
MGNLRAANTKAVRGKSHTRRGAFQPRLGDTQRRGETDRRQIEKKNNKRSATKVILTQTAVNFNITLTKVCYNFIKEVNIMAKILIVEDDVKLNQIVCKYLNNNNYQATGCTNPNEAYDLLFTLRFDLIISDIMMPQVDGFEFAETLRGTNKTIPILFMTSRDDISSKQKGFKIGIDDYLVKPFDMDEMVLRVGALLRRANITNEHKITVGGLTLDEDERCAYVDGEEISLSNREFNILYKLLSYPKKTFTRSQLIDEFWGLESESGLRTVDVFINKLREKFSICEDFEIVTIRGFGYKAVLK